MQNVFKTSVTIVLLLFLQWTTNAQNNTVSGAITDQASGETLIGAAITVTELPGKGAASNEYGFYSLSLPPGTYTLVVRYVGYTDWKKTIDLTKGNQRLDIPLADNATLEEVEIKAVKVGENIEKPMMGVEKLSMAEVKKLPTLMGERDIIRSLQLLPGVKSGGEGSGGLFVRGGNSDQNLILLDEAPVYNASHLLGFFSTFNADAIKDATLYKGGMPAQYGGRLSSVLDMKMNDGNNQEYQVSGGIGLISSKLNVEGPIQKGKSSFLVTGRRTYVDLFLKASSDTSLSGSRLYFYDLNAKLNYQIGSKDRLYLSGYFGQDVLGFGDEFGLNWGNKTGTLRWNHIYNDRLFSNTSLIFSDYTYNINLRSGTNDISITSTIQDWNLKQDFQYFVNSNNTLRFGANFIHHNVTPGQIEASEESSVNIDDFDQRRGLESAAYLTHEWKATDRLTVLSGVRLSVFNVLGGSTFNTYDAEGNLLTTRETERGDIVKTYINPEPRLSLSYVLNTRQSLKLSYNRNVQNLHLLSNSNTSNPTDLWVLTTENIRPELADQVSAGWFQNFGAEQGYEFSAETYYKYLYNQIDYRNGAEITANNEVEKELLYGSGRAYGLELLLRKKTGKLTGWVGYTLSRTERKIDGINNGNYYPNRYDRTHDVTLVAMYQLSRRWNVSANWVWYTGNATTFPSGKYEVDGVTTYVYTDRNGYRMPDYHRLDLGATYQSRKTKRFESEWAFSVYNAYNRKNAYSITFRDSTDNPGTTEAVRTALFGIVPSVSYNFKF